MSARYEDFDLIPADDSYAPDEEDGYGPPSAPQLRAVQGDDAGSSHALDGEKDPHGPDVHQVANHVDSFRWLLAELGARGLSGMLLRGDVVVHTSQIDEDGYIPPPPSAEGTPEHKRNSNGPATIRPVTVDTIVARLTLAYLVWKWAGKGERRFRTETFFPAEAAKIALEVVDQAPNLRQLRGVTHTPMVRADGSIITEPGYDNASGYLYLPDVEVKPVPANPTAEQLAAATKLLRGIVDEFAWAGEHDEANFHGLLLTPILRELCPPPYKMGAIMARQPGSGKSLLNSILREVHGGVFRSEMPHDDAELEKSISSILTCTSAPVVQFDNVSGKLSSSRLAGLLTSDTYSGRLLGSTNNTDMVNDRLWTITGNNLNLGGDLVRRSIWVTIDPRVPNPELRTGFKLDIPTYLREHRGDILHALLVWVAAWKAAGAPRATLDSSDSYGAWIATVRGILGHAGIPGTFSHAESAQQKVGGDDEGWGAFLESVLELTRGRPFIVRELIEKMDRAHNPLMGPANQAVDPIGQALIDNLPPQLHDKLHMRGPRAVSQSLGIWFANRNGRFAGQIVAEQAGTDSHRKCPVWQVRRADGSLPAAPGSVAW